MEVGIVKLLFPANILVGATLLAGCVSQQRALVLGPIGPPNLQSARDSSTGTLVVFSAFDTHGDFNDLPYLRHYTDYRITSEDGNAAPDGPQQRGLIGGRPQEPGTPSRHVPRHGARKRIRYGDYAGGDPGEPSHHRPSGRRRFVAEQRCLARI